MKPPAGVSAEGISSQLSTVREHLELALEGAALGTWDWDIRTGKAFVNARWAEMLGYRPDEIAPRYEAWQELVHPDDWPAVSEALKEHLSGRTSIYQVEHRLRHRDGRWVWVLSHGRVCERAADGSPLRAAGIHQDISQRKAAEEALLFGSEIYKNTVELTTQIPWIASPDGAIINCDPVWETFTGRSLLESLSDQWVQSIHPDDRARMLQHWTTSLATGQPYRVVHRLQRADGEYRRVESRAQPQRDSGGKIVRWYGTTEDIHERTAAEQALRESEARLALALEGAQLATWDSRVRTGEVVRSRRWLEMLGYEQSDFEPTAEFWTEQVHPEDRSRVAAQWSALCQGKLANYRAEYRIRHKSGEWRWMLSHGQVVERDDQGPTRACGINQDITERRRTEEALANSERFSRLLLDAYQDCVVLLDETGDILYANPAGLRRLGIRASASVGRASWLELWRKEERRAAQRALKIALAGDSAAFQGYIERAGFSSELWDVLLSPLPDSSRTKKILTVSREITRLKEQEERQRAIDERERLQTILENLNEGIIIAAPGGSVVLMNRAAQQMYGFDATGSEGGCQLLIEVVDAEDPAGRHLPASERPLMRALRGEAFAGYEAFFMNRRSGRKWIGSCGSTPVQAPSGDLLLAVISVREITAERRASDEIRRANQVLQDLSAQLLRSQDDERRRIARELHDGTVQVLSAAILNLTVLENSPELGVLEFEKRLAKESLVLARQGVTELRTLSYLLHPPMLDELGLVPALRSWVDGFSERTGIPVDLTLPNPTLRLTPKLETTLFRITQEALANVHRHANSETAAVSLVLSPKRIRLQIEDEGKGMSTGSADLVNAPLNFGIGLLGMRERARELGGSLVVKSRPGKTIIRVTLPRKENGAEST